MIFRLPRRAGALDPERIQILAHPRQRALVQEAGQIIGGIGQQFAAAEPDEQIEEFLADGAIVGCRGGGSEFDMRHAEIGRIALQRRDALERVRVGRLAEQQRQQAVFRGAQLIDLVDFGFRCHLILGWSVEIGAKNVTMHLRQRLDGENPFGGNPRPRRNRRLRNADPSRQRRDTTCCPDCLFQTGVTHGATDFSPAHRAS